jgi:CheY-like chemotaxis protein
MAIPRILCVHERGAVLDELQRTLEASGCEVVPVNDGQSALRVLAEGCVDGIVLSYDMNAPDGRLLRNLVRHLHPEMPMLLFSNLDEIRDMPLHVFSAYVEHPGEPALALAD